MPAGRPIFTMPHSLSFFSPQAAQVHPVACGTLPGTAAPARGNTLGDHRAMATPATSRWKPMTKNRFSTTLDDSRQEQEVQRPLGIPHRSQDGRAEVIEHAGRHADEIDAHVQAGLVQHFFWGAHQLQHGGCQGNADDQHNAAKDQAGQHRGVHRLPPAPLRSLAPYVLGHPARWCPPKGR